MMYFRDLKEGDILKKDDEVFYIYRKKEDVVTVYIFAHVHRTQTSFIKQFFTDEDWNSPNFYLYKAYRTEIREDVKQNMIKSIFK